MQKYFFLKEVLSTPVSFSTRALIRLTLEVGEILFKSISHLIQHKECNKNIPNNCMIQYFNL